MKVELVRCHTADGLDLDGAFALPERPGTALVEACLLVPGTGANFYTRGVLEAVAQAALMDGVATLRINTRGHDLACYLPGRKPGVFGGSSFERLDECPHDLTAWLDWLFDRGYRRVALVGHSLGAVKSIYSQVHAAHPAVLALLAISPPRLDFDWWQQHPLAGPFRDDYARAGAFAQAGQKESLLEVSQPFPYVTTAEAYLEKYGPEARYDVLSLLPLLRSPVLLLVGDVSEKKSPAFSGTLEAIWKNQRDLPRVTAERVPGADISYRESPDLPWRRFQQWLARQPPEIWLTSGSHASIRESSLRESALREAALRESSQRESSQRDSSQRESAQREAAPPPSGARDSAAPDSSLRRSAGG